MSSNLFQSLFLHVSSAQSSLFRCFYAYDCVPCSNSRTSTLNSVQYRNGKVHINSREERVCRPILRYSVAHQHAHIPFGMQPHWCMRDVHYCWLFSPVCPFEYKWIYFITERHDFYLYWTHYKTWFTFIRITTFRL